MAVEYFFIILAYMLTFIVNCHDKCRHVVDNLRIQHIEYIAIYYGIQSAFK